MDRRKFLNWVGVGMLASNLPVLIAACTSSSQTKTETGTENTNPEVMSSNAEDFITIGSSEELSQKGYLLDEKNNVIVIKKPDNSLSALNSKCTHKGCTVDWDKSAQNIDCDCHGSVFAVDGKVVKGPANQPLAMYQVKEENGSILVKV
jgi:cytochrome b6-f complex iron-sulfur subunit